MTHQIYSKEQLSQKNRTELWTICKQRGLKCYPRSADCVAAILEAQPQKAETSEGLRLSDSFQEVETIEPEEHTLEPVGKTDRQIAYVVREKGLMIGLIFQLGRVWQCGDGKNYENSVDAIAGLKALSNPSKVVPISQGKMEVTRVNNEAFSVLSTSGKTYTVHPYRHSPRDRCNCPHAHYRGVKCKHQNAVEEFIAADNNAIEHKLDKLITKHPWLYNRADAVAFVRSHIPINLFMDWEAAVNSGDADDWLNEEELIFDDTEIAIF